MCVGVTRRADEASWGSRQQPAMEPTCLGYLHRIAAMGTISPAWWKRWAPTSPCGMPASVSSASRPRFTARTPNTFVCPHQGRWRGWLRAQRFTNAWWATAPGTPTPIEGVRAATGPPHPGLLRLGRDRLCSGAACEGQRRQRHGGGLHAASGTGQNARRRSRCRLHGRGLHADRRDLRCRLRRGGQDELLPLPGLGSSAP